MKITDLHRNAPYIDKAVLVGLIFIGFFHFSPTLYFISFFVLLAILIFGVLGGSFLFYNLTKYVGKRIQGVRKKTPPILDEIKETSKAMVVAASLGAWPVGLYQAGVPTGFSWTLEEMGLNWWQVVLQMYFGIVLIDAYTYWKHRLLHTPYLYAFHKHHHTFKDPTPFSGFAVGPVEALLTFSPVLLVCIPEAKHFVPLYLSAIIGFISLNLYLHCGVTFKFAEKILPILGLNSSAWHNVHHSDFIVNFGEVSFIWDKICKTSKEALNAKAKA